MTGEWIKKMWYVYTIEYSLTLKKETVICDNMMNGEDIILRETRSQRKTNTAQVHLYEAPKTDKFIELKSGMVVFRG